MNDTFPALGIDDTLTRKLADAGIVRPTPIQQQAIPAGLAGRDVVGRSTTGTGKTLAYLLPLIARIDATKRENQALIMAPTHELVIQIQRQLELLLADLPVKSAPLIGNANISRQIDKLKEKPQILVGSAGRVLELIQKRKIAAAGLQTVVLDEADRLLDEQNRDTVKSVLKTTRKERQLMLFSATITPQTLEHVREYLHDPVLVSVDGRPQVAGGISHMYFVCERRDKIDVLRKLVHSNGLRQGLVFLNNSDDIETTAAKLNYHGLKAAGLHGAFTQEARKKALDDFRQGKIVLLVASDVAARGLDIRGVDYVYNLDMPEDPELYLHRAGRTGRAGDEGFVMTVATPADIPLIEACERSLAISVDRKVIREGRIWTSGRHQGSGRESRSGQHGSSQRRRPN